MGAITREELIPGFRFKWRFRNGRKRTQELVEVGCWPAFFGGAEAAEVKTPGTWTAAGVRYIKVSALLERAERVEQESRVRRLRHPSRINRE